jgi:formylglycine-generating enzyme required for sulfatase activity
MTRIFSLLLPFALSVGCGGTVVAQQVETQPVAPRKEQTSAVATGGQPKEVVNSIGMKLLLLPAGTFTMGSTYTEEFCDDDETQHQVTLSKPFYMCRTEVTQGQWKKVMGTEPWKGEDYVQEGDDCPAVYISWDDAVAFCKKLSENKAKPIACRRKPNGNTPAAAAPKRPSVLARKPGLAIYCGMPQANSRRER